ncbi:hypothetical protein Pf1_00366 [Flavobacterium columnare]|nr:hypothetical protein Pf1_00366 [Flavobacterium columnare]
MARSLMYLKAISLETSINFSCCILYFPSFVATNTVIVPVSNSISKNKYLATFMLLSVNSCKAIKKC